MEQSLEVLIDATEIQLRRRPEQYDVPLGSFDDSDNEILAEFLRQERDEDSSYAQYESYEMLVGNPEQFTNPKQFLEESAKKMLLATRMMERNLSGFSSVDEEAKGFLKNLGMDINALVAVGENMPIMLGRSFEMKMMLYGSIVAYAKQLAAEQGIDAVDVVKEQQNRDKIYRRILPTKEMFDCYSYLQIGIEATIISVAYPFIEMTLTTLTNLTKIPVVGWLAVPFIKKHKKEFEKLPPKNIAGEYLKDEYQHKKELSERIYCGAAK